MKYKAKGFPQELSDRIRRVNIRHEALLAQNLEKIEKQQRTRAEQLESSIKLAERQAKFAKNGLASFGRITSTFSNDNGFYKDTRNRRLLGFLDRQVQGYRRTLEKAKSKEDQNKVPEQILLATGRTAETSFDAYFPPLRKERYSDTEGSTM